MVGKAIELSCRVQIPTLAITSEDEIEMKRQCNRCKEVFDPAYSFINDVDDAQAFVDLVADPYNYCGQCSEDIIDEMKGNKTR